MRLLLIVPMVPQADGIGAIPKLLAAELDGLTERGVEVTLLGTYGDLPGQAEAAAALAAAGVDAHFFDGRRPADARGRLAARRALAGGWLRNPWPWRAVSLVRGMQPLLDRLAASRELDVVAYEDSAMAPLRPPAGVPTVLTEHEAERAPASDWSGGPLRERPLRRLQAADWGRLDRFQREAWHRFDLLQVFSESDAADVRSREPGVAARLRINPFGMEVPSAADPAREEEDLILFTGTFTHLPNRDAAAWLAAEIAPAIRARRPGARLRIVGSAPPREVRELAGEGVEVIADAPSLDPHIDAAAVVIAPIRSGGGMRLKVLEAMGKGKAVVTTPRGTDGFTHFGEPLPLVVGEDAAALAEGCAGLLADREGRRRLGTEARAFVERRCSPTAWADRLIAVYEEAAGATAKENSRR
jgi:polysaccharide biosynthesis protein PslH